MKKIFFVLLAILLFAIPCNSQLDTISQQSITDTIPMPSDINAFNTWINDNNQLKNASDTLDKNDKVFVQFTVETTGDLSNIVIVRGFAPIYDKEAYRLISSCPILWTPAVKNGKKIAAPFTMPIYFIDVPTKPDNK